MKKAISAVIITALIILCGCGKTYTEPDKLEIKNDTVCAVWIYFDELSMKSENGGTSESFTAKISDYFDICTNRGINTVFVQVRPCCDALYKSEMFPQSAYLTGTQGKNTEYDPLEIIIKEAKKRSLSIHAWLNPFRISFSQDLSLLSENNPAMVWIKSDKDEDRHRIVKVNDGLYFSPPDEEVQKLIIDGVREILKNYDVDGIHIDDYFYPSAEKSVDSYYFDNYKKAGGTLELKQWRLNVISAFIQGMYNAVKTENPDCIFSISPQGNISNNYNSQFADVELWCAEKGYCDWIIPQIYYSFDNKILPFDKACEEWNDIIKCDSVKLIYGLAGYKVGSGDEWDSDIIQKQIDFSEKMNRCDGFAFFSMEHLSELLFECKTQHNGGNAQQKP